MRKNEEVIWPLSIRLIHWSIAFVVLLDAFWLEEGDAPHRYLGYLAAGLVFIRAGMGVLGKGAVLFSSMPIRPSELKFFLLKHFKGEAHYDGHNPLASVVYLLIWALILALGVTGWMLGLDAFWGSEELGETHAQLSNALIGCVVIHMIGLSLDAFIYKRKTWLGMIDGKKK